MIQASKMSPDQLLEVENDERFLNLDCPDTGVPAWPAIRNDFFRVIITERLYRGAAPPGSADKLSLKKVSESAIRSRLDRIAHRQVPSPILLRASGVGLVPRSGKLFNRLCDYFTDELADRYWLLESVARDNWPRGQRYARRVSFTGDLRLATALGARIGRRPVHMQLARELIALAASRARAVLGFDLSDTRARALTKTCAKRLSTYRFQSFYFKRLFNRLGTRLALVEEGCYGHMAVFNTVAHRHDITIAEFQHGWVSPGHDAYNFGAIVRESQAFRDALPDVFLGFGDYGNQLFNAPIEKLAIGNPHRSAELESIRRTERTTSQTILVLGDGIDTDGYLQTCRELAELVPEWTIRFRPHPLERARVPAGDHNFEIDPEPDIYASLASCECVVGEMSTALFEAAGITPRVLVWNTPKSRFTLGDHPFETFDDLRDLRACLVSPARGALPPATIDSIWAPDWRQRFREFVSSRCP
ncbi:MAG: hypothetical protein KJO07_22100 [Deltaproteobacteria bacterium]|nr:hypothetical protein [Deltaproteobacteria bacterium]